MVCKAIAASLTAAALLSGAAAADPPNFDFYGYADIPAGVGGTLTLRSVLTNNGVVPTPITLDFTNNQYTLVVVATLASDIPPRQQYTPATIQIFQDPIAGGTAADYAVPGTFTDGTLILGGAFDGALTRLTFTATLGSFVGKVDFTGGTRLGDLATAQDWPFGGGWSRTVTGIPAGYEENWDGKVDLSVVGVEPRSWQDVKSIYRGH